MSFLQVLLTFFYAVFLGLALNSAGKMRTFATHKMFVNRKAFLRIICSFIIINVFPVITFAYLYNSVFTLDVTSSYLSIFAVVAASLSVFGFNRVLTGIIISDECYKYFYDEEEWKEIVFSGARKSADYTPNNWWCHVLPGVIWLIFFWFLMLFFLRMVNPENFIRHMVIGVIAVVAILTSAVVVRQFISRKK